MSMEAVLVEKLQCCTLCAHNCKVNRLDGKIGRCRCLDKVKIALCSLHRFEEPCISGKNGSGTIFFSNCNFNCIYCQNYEISQQSKGKDYSVEELCKKFDIDSDTKPKNLGSLIAYRILGIKGNKTSEFEKAGIVVKTIRIENNGKIREHMSFPNFKFAEIVKENWEDSTFRNYLADTRFFFVVYKYDNQGVLRLKGCQFWNIPYDDLNGNVKKVWTETVNVLKKGLHISEVNGRLTNNFPKSSDNSICHVRPHARNQNDVDMLPNGDYYPKQCFWFNNNYILSQLDITL